MIRYSRGGAVARCAHRFASITLSGILAVGCGKPHLALLNYFVNIQELASLHPSWPQIVSMQHSLNSQSEYDPHTSLFPLPPHSENASFTIAPSASQSIVMQRQKPIEDYVMRYLQQSADLIRLRNTKRIAREKLIEARNTLIQMAAARKQLQITLASEHLLKSNQLDRDIARLGYRDIALQSQIRVYSGQSLKDALLQRQIVQAQIQSKSEEQSHLLGDVMPEVEKILEPKKIALEQKSRERIAALQTYLNLDAEKIELSASSRNMKAVQDLMPDSESIPLIGSEKSIASIRNAKSLNISLQHLDYSNFESASGRTRAASDREKAAWEIQINRLKKSIEQDVQQCVVQIARKENWKLAAAGSPYSSDRTSEVARELRLQWNPTSRRKTP